MSPSRTRRPVKHRSRSEVLTAVAGAAAVVLVTVVLIWLLRPGAPGTEGTGGLASRQPRAAWLVGLALGALIVFTWWAVRRQQQWRGKLIVVLGCGWLIVALVAVLGGILWPGGLLRHTEAPPDVSQLEGLPSTSLPAAPGSTQPGATAPTTTAESATTGGP
jgi:peptidoglycan biosynthesis protein MviN/MurJ (putative lipid II flippase)